MSASSTSGERLVCALLTLLAISVTYLYIRMYHARYKQYATLPQLPTSLLWGHLQTFHTFSQGGPADQHPGTVMLRSNIINSRLEHLFPFRRLCGIFLTSDQHLDLVFSGIRDALGKPSIIFVDLRPITYPMVVILSHEVAEQVTRPTKAFPQSVPKSETEKHNVHLLGPKSILTAEGEAWSGLRKRFNSGFAPAHLMTLLPAILGRIPKFIQHLDAYSMTGAEFPLGSLLGNLMFDIIGIVIMDVDLGAQNEPARQGELIRVYRELLYTYANDPQDLPWWIVPLTELKRRRLGKRLNELLRAVVQSQHSAQQQAQRQQSMPGVPAANRSRSILSLALQDAKELSPDLVDETCDQIKTFLFAGFDTSSSVAEWAFYELSRTPRVLATLQAELDALLGPETAPEAVLERLLASGPDILRRMKYTAAVFKEVLRLHPPAATARMTKSGTDFTLRTADGKEHCVDGANLYICHSLIQRDPAVYGDSADAFMPERWLDFETASTELSSSSSLDQEEFMAAAKCRAEAPIGAWRPFERGPRKCIGQDFAKIEAYVVLAVTARRYEFVKTGLGEVVRDDQGRPIMGRGGQNAVKSKLYEVRFLMSPFLPPSEGSVVCILTN